MTRRLLEKQLERCEQERGEGDGAESIRRSSDQSGAACPYEVCDEQATTIPGTILIRNIQCQE